MLELLDIEDYISKNKIPRVVNPQSFKDQEPTPDGLYSPRIFGSLKKEKMTQMGYIDLQVKILHPLIFNNLKRVNSIFGKIFKFKMKIIDGKLHLIDKNQNKDKSKKIEEGMSVSWLYENWMKIDFEHYMTPKNEDFIKLLKAKGRDKIFITKFLVIPQAFREYVEEFGRLIEDEISGMYKKILLITQSADFKQSDYAKFLESQSNKSRINVIQKYVNNIHDLLLAKLGGGKYTDSKNVKIELNGKKAVMRSKVLGKRINNVSRLVANARPDIPFNAIALPWYVIIYLFDMYIINYLVQHQSSTRKLQLENASLEEVGKHIDYIYKNIESYIEKNEDKLEEWYKVIQETLEAHPDLTAMVKRDPSWNKCSWISLKPIIMKGMNYHLVINSVLYVPLGGDSFNTNIFGHIEKKNILYQDKDIKILTDNTNILEINTLERTLQKNEN